VSFEPAVAAHKLALNAGNDSLQTFKELEGEASQLNRLDFRSSKLVAQSRSLLGVFVGASRQYSWSVASSF